MCGPYECKWRLAVMSCLSVPAVPMCKPRSGPRHLQSGWLLLTRAPHCSSSEMTPPAARMAASEPPCTAGDDATACMGVRPVRGSGVSAKAAPHRRQSATALTSRFAAAVYTCCRRLLGKGRSKGLSQQRQVQALH